MLLETTSKFRADSETAAKDMIEKYRQQAIEKGYILKKAGYEYKVKKSKGEIIAQAWVVSITQIFNELWGDVE